MADSNIMVWVKEAGGKGSGCAFKVFVSSSADVDDLKKAIALENKYKFAANELIIRRTDTEDGDVEEEDKAVSTFEYPFGKGKSTPIYFSQPAPRAASFVYDFGFDCKTVINRSILFLTIFVPLFLLFIGWKTKNDLMYDNMLPAIMSTVFAVFPANCEDFRPACVQVLLAVACIVFAALPYYLFGWFGDGFMYAVGASVVTGACGTIFSKHCCMKGASNSIASWDAWRWMLGYRATPIQEENDHLL